MLAGAATNDSDELNNRYATTSKQQPQRGVCLKSTISHQIDEDKQRNAEPLANSTSNNAIIGKDSRALSSK